MCSADVVVLAESAADNSAVLYQLNSEGENYRYSNVPEVGRFTVFTRFPKCSIVQIHEEDRLDIRSVSVDGSQDILLGILHLPSKLEMSDNDQALECTRYSERIRMIEERFGHRRTVVVGDFNMNPFEFGVIAARGFNAVMTRSVAGRESRTVQGLEYPFFYNPMWTKFGDLKNRPSGSCYFDMSGRHENYYWNIFDQVLVRPELMHNLREDDLHILTDDGVETLLDKNDRPNSQDASDHLPITFKLSF
ncbi:MAG TPA: hypothetical protein VKX17_25610 [Planctomycetota bacterium]|nr:hypothetical protein [Planctomycetota bacterium]